MRRLIDDTDTGFAAMNAALKARATSVLHAQLVRPG